MTKWFIKHLNQNLPKKYIGTTPPPATLSHLWMGSSMFFFYFIQYDMIDN